MSNPESGWNFSSNMVASECWGPWRKRFAVLPTKLGMNKKWVWWTVYYERYNGWYERIERGELFDVLKS